MIKTKKKVDHHMMAVLLECTSSCDVSLLLRSHRVASLGANVFQVTKKESFGGGYIYGDIHTGGGEGGRARHRLV